MRAPQWISIYFKIFYGFAILFAFLSHLQLLSSTAHDILTYIFFANLPIMMLLTLLTCGGAEWEDSTHILPGDENYDVSKKLKKLNTD